MSSCHESRMCPRAAAWLCCREKPLKRTTRVFAGLVRELDLAPTDQVRGVDQRPDRRNHCSQQEQHSWTTMLHDASGRCCEHPWRQAADGIAVLPGRWWA